MVHSGFRCQLILEMKQKKGTYTMMNSCWKGNSKTCTSCCIWGRSFVDAIDVFELNSSNQIVRMRGNGS